MWMMKRRTMVNWDWEEKAFEEDIARSHVVMWPPRCYSCSFCKREFRSAQALGGHMNVHRRDRAARLKLSLALQQNHHFHDHDHAHCFNDHDHQLVVENKLPSSGDHKVLMPRFINFKRHKSCSSSYHDDDHDINTHEVVHGVVEDNMIDLELRLGLN